MALSLRTRNPRSSHPEHGCIRGWNHNESCGEIEVDEDLSTAESTDYYALL
jgi:hypothetical protein